MTSEKQPELLDLIHAVCERTLTQADADRLATLLRGDREAQAFYLRRVHLHAALQWDLGSAAECAAVQRLAQQRSPSRPQPRFPSLGWAAIAATLLVAVTVALWPRPRQRPPGEQPVVAILAHAVDARWEGGSPPTTGDSLRPEKLRLREGVARIEFPGGAAITLEGPAEFTPLGPDRSLLHHGRLTARVPDQTSGFVIETPHTQVARGGTQFGLMADRAGSVEVCVFEGQVAVGRPEPARPLRRVEAGKAVRVETGTSRISSIVFDAGGYRRTWPVNLGVASMTGAVQVAAPGLHRRPSHHENEQLVVFPEHLSVMLQRDIEATVDQPGSYRGPFAGRVVSVRRGTHVRTYLLQFNPVGRKKGTVRRVVGSVTFERPVIALIATNAQLAATDRGLGSEIAPRTGRGSRGLEGGDGFTLSPDRRTVSIDFTAAAGVDQLRVLVDAQP